MPIYIHTHTIDVYRLAGKQRVRLFSHPIPNMPASHTSPPPPRGQAGTNSKGLSVQKQQLLRKKEQINVPRDGQPQHPREASALQLHRKPRFPAIKAGVKEEEGETFRVTACVLPRNCYRWWAQLSWMWLNTCLPKGREMNEFLA